MTNDIIDSMRGWFKEKTNSPLYFTYILLAIIWNWKILYILFFESPTFFDAPRIEYLDSLQQIDLPYQFINWVLNTCWHILPPAVFTLLAVKYLPFINHWAHNIYLDHYFLRKELFDKKNLEYERRRTGNIGEIAKEKQEQTKSRKTIRESSTQEERWDEEFDKLSHNLNFINSLNKAIVVVYKTSGNFTTHPESNRTSLTYIDPESLSRLDTSGIISFSKGDYGDKISFTDKGKYFVSKVQDR